MILQIGATLEPSLVNFKQKLGATLDYISWWLLLKILSVDVTVPTFHARNVSLFDNLNLHSHFATLFREQLRNFRPYRRHTYLSSGLRTSTQGRPSCRYSNQII